MKLFWGTKDEDHNYKLIRCLEKTQKIGMAINMKKRRFKATGSAYLDHKLTSDGTEQNRGRKQET